MTQKRDDLAEEIKLQTTSLLTTQKARLEKQAETAQASVQPLLQQRNALESDIEDLKYEKTSLIEEVKEQTTALAVAKTAMEEVASQHIALSDDLLSLSQATEAANANLDALNRTIASKKEEIKSLEEETRLIGVKKVELEKEADSYSQTFAEKRAQDEKMLTDLGAKIMVSSQKLLEHDKKVSAELEDIARRKLELDKQDKNLRIRERRVAQDEQTIANNAHLLNL